MAEPYVAEIRIWACNFAPKGWALCAGQILPISQNTALFSLIGTFFGGNGTSNFQLPNLQGYVPMCIGNGPGLTPRSLGEEGGSENVTLLITEMPIHNHAFSVDPANKRESPNVSNNVPAAAAAGETFYSTSNPNQNMHPQMLTVTGQSQPHDNMQPYLCLNFCIALEGIYPSRG